MKRLILTLAAIAIVASPEALPDATRVSFEQSTRDALALSTRSDVLFWDVMRWRESLGALYARRGFQPLWIVEGKLTRNASQLLAELQAVEGRGLLAADYDAHELARRAQLVATSGAADAARLDVAFSVVAARLASDLHQGRVTAAEMGYDLEVPRPKFDAGVAMEKLAAAPDVRAALDALEPPFRQTARLKTALARYRELARRPELTRLPPLPRTSVREGERYEGAPALRRLLRAVGDLDSPAAVADMAAGKLPAGKPVGDVSAGEATLDAGLVAALARFQARHGLDADGVLGRATFRELTTPFSTRVQQIVLSLERARWLPAFDTPPIIVNVPQFRLYAFRTTRDMAQDILQMDVIVGSDFPGRRTPVFAADMRYVVLQPYWDVPRSILLNELLPEIRKNPGWVAKNGYEIVRGQSDDAQPVPVTEANVKLLAQGALRLRQKPGPLNALGRVKFMLPNRHSVYLHDTPVRDLFSRSRRAFSHGCIRVQDPMTLLAFVLRDDPTWNEERRDLALASKTPVRVPLSRPIRVFILYGTAIAGESGETRFFEDLYNRDAPLTSRLASRRQRVTSVSGLDKLSTY